MTDVVSLAHLQFGTNAAMEGLRALKDIASSTTTPELQGLIDIVSHVADTSLGSLQIVLEQIEELRSS